MAQYILKSTLIAEIKRRQSEHDEKKYDYASSDHFWASVEDGKILSLIDTLEVKEVDLEKESLIRKDIGTIDRYEEHYKAVLSRFKAQKGENV